MKYLSKIFALDDRKSQQESSAAFTSTLYSVIFVSKSSQQSHKTIREDQDDHEELTSSVGDNKHKVTILLNGESVEYSSNKHPQLSRRKERKKKLESGLCSYLLTAKIGKTEATTSAISSLDDYQPEDKLTTAVNNDLQKIEEVDDWILVDRSIFNFSDPHNNSDSSCKSTLRQIETLAMDKTDVELIRASWNPMRKDPVTLGVLLFKGLFTKFPQYLKFFPQFADLDIDRMQENKRLLKHAVKVIETVTFVVDSIADETKATKLNEALVNLVRSHLKRRIGLNEFHNLGIVLIDFICDVNHRRGAISVKDRPQLSKSSVSNNSSNDSETMTSVLDKIHASSSPSSSSEEESYLTTETKTNTTTINNNNLNRNFTLVGAHDTIDDMRRPPIDTNVLVTAWTKLYSSILDLVKHEEEQENKRG